MPTHDDATNTILAVSYVQGNVVLEVIEDDETVASFTFSPAKADAFAAALINNAMYARRELPKL